MAQSSLWDRIDPASEFRVQTGGYAETGEDPSRQTASSGSPAWSPKHHNFPFLVVLGMTGLAAWEVFEHGAGAGARARLGPAKADIDLDVEGKRGNK